MDSFEKDKLLDEDIDNKKPATGGETKPTAVSDDKDGGYVHEAGIKESNEKKDEKVSQEINQESTCNSNNYKLTELSNDKEFINSPKIYGNARNHYLPAIKSQAHLPKRDPPQPQRQWINPPKVELSRSLSIVDTMPSIVKYITDRSNSFTEAIVKRLTSLKGDKNDNSVIKNDSLNFEVTEFKIPGVKVIVQLKTEAELLGAELKGRISFFTRSNCKECTAVRHFFREKRLLYVEINIDVFPQREKDLIERTGNSRVPQIFFNEKLFGGLVDLNELEKSGKLEEKLKEMVGEKCPRCGPAIPVYGVDDEEGEEDDDLVETVKFLRKNLDIQDRLLKLQMVYNCFSGVDLLEAIFDHLDCSRRKGIMTAKRMAQKHFIHHVFGENDFEEGNHFYRFLEHEPYIVGCFNFKNSTNDSEPKSASFLADRLSKLMFAILEAYASDDRLHLNYHSIRKSEEFRRYLNVVGDLQRVNMKLLTPNERLTFFLNLHNAMAIHAVIAIGHPVGILEKRAFYNEFLYVVGGYPYSLSTIVNGILRHNRTSPYSLTKPYSKSDRRLELAPTKVNPLIHFGLCNGTRSSPAVRFFSGGDDVENVLKCAAKEYFQSRGAIQFNMDKRTVYLTRIIKWYNEDFGQDKEALRWVMNYLDSTQAGILAHLLAHLLADEGQINVVYQDYDWSGNL